MNKKLAAAVLLFLGTACGGSTDGGGFTPRSDDQLVLKIENRGGFVPVEISLTGLPSLALYADGTVIVPGPQIEIYPPPAFPNLRTRKVDRAKVIEVLDAAREAGLTEGDRKFENNMVADASTAVFTVDDGTRVSVTEVYALDIDGETGDRGKISAFNQEVFSIIGEGEDAEYLPERFQIIVTPASAGNQPDDIQVSHQPWPLDDAPTEIGQPHQAFGDARSRCAITEGDANEKLMKALRSANTLTQWDHEGASYRMFARPLLPGEEGCVD